MAKEASWFFLPAETFTDQSVTTDRTRRFSLLRIVLSAMAKDANQLFTVVMTSSKVD